MSEVEEQIRDECDYTSSDFEVDEYSDNASSDVYLMMNE